MLKRQNIGNEMELFLSKFPKKRSILPPEYQRIYEKEYELNRNGSSVVTRVSSYLEEWMHKKVAGTTKQGKILELGAGTLNHFNHAKDYSTYDVVEPFTRLYQNSENKKNVNDFYSDISDIPTNKKYDRIISIAVLEHLTELPKIIAQSVMKMEEGGVFQAGIPTEGGFLWKLAYKTTTGPAYWLRNRLNYNVIMEHEHVNTASEIVLLINHMFQKTKISRYPTPLFHTSFYTYLEAEEPCLKTAESILKRYENDTK